MSHTRLFRIVFLTFALSAGGLAASAQEPASASSLARRILADPNLQAVLAKAESLLKTGFNAGSGYGEVWIRDLNTFIEMSLRVNDAKTIREALLTFFKFQGDDGNIPDGYIPKAQANVAYKYRQSALAPDFLAHKNTVETDQEFSLVQAVRRYVAITKDTAFLDEQVGGLSVRQRLAKALDYVLTHRFDAAHGLVWGATTADWGDVQPEHEWGVELNENSHRTLDIYDNAMLIIAIDDYLSLVGDADAQSARWRQARDDLRTNVRKHLWDADRRKFKPHVYLEGSPFPETFDEAAVYYHGGTAVAIEAGLLSQEEISDSLKQMRENIRKASASSIGLTLYPPYPQGTFQNPSMGPYSYQNGGDWCWFGGRMIRQLVRHGLVEDAYRELTPMTDRVLRHGDFYEWWSRDNQPRGSGQYRGSAGVLGIAIVELLAWAKEHQDSPAVLWQIGQTDEDNAELALAPQGWGQYQSDGFYVVGGSDSKKDWPYAHPGPSDAWAGARSHTFVVLFGLAAAPSAGECRLAVHLLDTHSAGPPTVQIEINDKSFERSLPAGAGDASINGEPGKGAKRTFEIAFPAGTLKAGDNEIRVTTIKGSWMLYDSVEMIAPAGLALAEVRSRTLIEQARPMRALMEQGGRTFQPVTVALRHFGEEADGEVRLGNGQAVPLRLTKGWQQVELLAADVQDETTQTVTVAIDGKTVASRDIVLKPVKKLTVYITPHSHTDIGYTEIQTAIEAKQVQNLVDGIAAAKRTADYPEGARFVWNVEVLWAADLYLRRLDDQRRADFLDAVRKGQVVLNGMYLNELTGLCRPEELVRLFKYSTELAAKTGVPIDSAMISDVPGYTWGTVTAMAQAGIRYFSVAPNYFDRIGTILREWENKPFYWVGPDGRSKVLVWIPFWGYAMSHRYGTMSAKLVEDFSDGLEKRKYPFDIAYVRWSGHGDNAVPDPAICEFVRDWNAKYAWPRFVICGTSEAFRAFEQRYGAQLPLVRGDWTPYWEDGAGSSALETAMNRASSDRLAQAEALFAMLKPAGYPRAAFEDAWNSVLLYSEHTWGAWCSVSEPQRKETLEQWEIKRGYAESADKQSRDLLTASLARSDADAQKPNAIDVFNTLSWPRTELATIPKSLSTGGDRVKDDKGKLVPSQRLVSGELVFLAKDVPPFTSRRYTIVAGAAHTNGRAVAQGPTLDSGAVRLRVDDKTGGIVELTARGLAGNFADTSKGEALNDYLYLIGDDMKDLRRNDAVTIRTGEAGPLVASLVIESPAPGCRKLVRELRVVAGLDYVEIINAVDKERLKAKSYHAKEGKESVNFAFPFAVPDGRMLLDLPLGMMCPEADQMPSACKNWFTVSRWADVSNNDRGVTWVTLDAPLLQVGGLTATLLNSQTDPNVWRAHVEPTQSLYCWAMNNHWGTNYRAYQEGLTTFRFVLRPHRKADPAEASRFATGFSQPLLVVPAVGKKPATKPLLTVEPADVLVTSLKPSDDGQALIVRLFGASDRARSARLKWSGRKPTAAFLSDASEHAGKPVSGPIDVPACGLVTLRVEFKP